jgi:hypothetical protein
MDLGKKYERITSGFVQLGHDVEAIIGIAVLLFRQTNIYLAFCC